MTKEMARRKKNPSLIVTMSTRKTKRLKTSPKKVRKLKLIKLSTSKNPTSTSVFPTRILNTSKL